jgi:hypothetical protein
MGIASLHPSYRNFFSLAHEVGEKGWSEGMIEAGVLTQESV